MAERTTVKEAAKRLGLSELTVRWGIINGTLPIGYYIQKPGSNRKTYYVSPELLDKAVKDGPEVFSQRAKEITENELKQMEMRLLEMLLSKAK